MQRCRSSSSPPPPRPPPPPPYLVSQLSINLPPPCLVRPLLSHSQPQHPFLDKQRLNPSQPPPPPPLYLGRQQLQRLKTTRSPPLCSAPAPPPAPLSLGVQVDPLEDFSVPPHPRGQETVCSASQ